MLSNKRQRVENICHVIVNSKYIRNRIQNITKIHWIPIADFILDNDRLICVFFLLHGVIFQPKFVTYFRFNMHKFCGSHNITIFDKQFWFYSLFFFIYIFVCLVIILLPHLTLSQYNDYVKYRLRSLRKYCKENE